MPIARIPQYISELEENKKQLSEDTEKLKVDELDMKARVYVLNKKTEGQGEEFQQFAGIKSELKKYGLEFNDLESFVETVRKAEELGYDVHLIGSKLVYWDELNKNETDLEEKILQLE